MENGNEQAFKSGKTAGLRTAIESLIKNKDEKHKFLKALVDKFPDFKQPMDNAIFSYGLLGGIQEHRGSGKIMVNHEDILKICLLAHVFYNYQKEDQKIVAPVEKPNGFVSMEYAMILCFVGMLAILLGLSFVEVAQAWIK